jgi:hypothetical protein
MESHEIPNENMLRCIIPIPSPFDETLQIVFTVGGKNGKLETLFLSKWRKR